MNIGIDEVGRGAWAGPLLVAAVQLPDTQAAKLSLITDSKMLTRKQRENLSITIQSVATYVGFGWVSAAEVDKLGLTGATQLGCQRAVNGAPDVDIIIDGHINFLPNNPKASCLIKADQIIPAVSAASIVAKVARDNYMAEQAKKHLNYGFEKHVGYGVKAHLEALKTYGITDMHRLSFKPVSKFVKT